MYKKKQQPEYSQITRDSFKTKTGVCCRVCLSSMDKNQIQHICLCKREESSIHERCLLQWIDNVHLDKQSWNRFYIVCNFCHTKIYMDTEVSYSCLPWRKVQICGTNKSCTISTFVLLIMGIIIFKASMYLLEHKNLDPLIGTIGSILFFFGMVDILLTIGAYLFTVCLAENATILGIKGGIKLDELRKRVQARKLQNNFGQNIKIQIESLESFCPTPSNEDILQSP